MSRANVLSRTEFVALMAMLSATIAFSIDAMLPALPEIAADLTPDAVNRAQLIITSFVFGMGFGTFVAGPLSDRFGRRAVMLGGAVLYSVAALAAWGSGSLELVLAARFVQGLGAAGPRVASMAMIRDLYAGRHMAQIMSFIMIVFTLVPAIAPTLGAGIVWTFGWRSIFLAFVVFSILSAAWLLIRQPETLDPGKRRSLNLWELGRGAAEVLRHPTVRLSLMVQTLIFGILFSLLSSTQQVFDQTFGQGDNFHLWFGGIALVSASASFLNARLVVRLGMRPLIRTVLLVQIFMSGATALLWIIGPSWGVGLSAYVLWKISIFFMAALAIGNINALAMEPMGHMAGLAASLLAALSTVGAVLIAAPIGLTFDGTPLPLSIGTLICATLAYVLAGRFVRPSDKPAAS